MIGQKMTKIADGLDQPRWSETFDVTVTNPDSDLITVQLCQTVQGGIYVMFVSKIFLKKNLLYW